MNFVIYFLISLNCFSQAGDLDYPFSILKNDSVYASVFQNDGKVIIGGKLSSSNNENLTRLNEEGSIDATFNIGVGFNNTVHSICLQQDGKLLIGGSFTSFNGVLVNRIIRLNSNGSIDNTFNLGQGFNAIVKSIIIQTDGKILIGGNFTSYNGISCNRMIRLNNDGSVDANFIADFNYVVNCIKVQNDGKIIVGGDFTYYSGSNRNKIIRLNSNGSIDNTFNVGVGFNNTVHSICLQQDGKLLIGGTFTSFNGVSVNRIIRLNSNGSIDNTFNVGQGFSAQGFNATVYSIEVQSSGKIIVGGEFNYYNGFQSNNIVRLEINGTNDSSFDVGIGYDAKVHTISIQNNNKIFVGGTFSQFNGIIVNKITKLDINGNIDTNFNPPFLGLNGYYVNDIKIQADGKIIVGGEFTSYNNISHNSLIRFFENGLVDETFNFGNDLTYGYVNSIAIQNDGKIIVGGVFQTSNENKRLLRLNNDGSIDNTFNLDVDFNLAVKKVHIQNDSKILVSGVYLGTNIRHLMRLNIDGSSDSTFVIGNLNNDVLSICQQNDNKLLIGGKFTSYNDTIKNYFVRLNLNGSIDTSFNNNHNLNQFQLGFNFHVYSIVVQQDNKILVGGDFSNYNFEGENGLIRLNLDGTKDNSFDIGQGFTNTISALSIQANGKILVGGAFHSFNGNVAKNIVRLNTNGSHDNSFSTGTGFDNLEGSPITCIAIQTDGKVLVGGGFSSYNGSNRNKILRLKYGCSITSSTIIQTSCGSYTLNGQNYYNNGLYTQSLISSTGCDSIIYLNLTINNQYDFEQNVEICQGDSFNFYGEDLINSGIYNHYFSSVFGCDSIITLNLIVHGTNGTDFQNNCGPYTWIDGITYSTNTNIPTYILQNALGCDSIVTLNLTINQPTSSSISEISCNEYTWHGTTYSNSGTYSTTLTNSNGCDSIVTLNLTINPLPTVNLPNLGSYCDTLNSFALSGGTPVGGQYSGTSVTNNNFDPSIGEGNYTVTYTYSDANGCSNSDNGNLTVIECVNTANLYENTISFFKIFPNPTNSNLNIIVQETNSLHKVKVLNLSGQTLGQLEFDSNAFTLDFSTFAKGIYFVDVDGHKEKVVFD